jgi:outer membrane receptor for ferrienterochelin and colicins
MRSLSIPAACGAVMALALAALAAPAAAQERTLTGTIRDARTDSAVAGATVLARGTLLGTVTDAVGHFRLAGLEPMAVVLQVFARGYRDTSLTVRAGATGPVAVRLEPAALLMAPVVVTASRRAEAAPDAAVSVSVLSDAILAKRDVSNIEAALPFVSGVTFNGPGEMDVRGSTGVAGGVGSRVLILLDGHPMLSADGGEIIWEALPLLDVDRVEVVKGAYSAVYGSNALGGVANIITSPIDAKPETVTRVHFGLYQIPSRYQFQSGAPAVYGVELQQSGAVGGVGVRLDGSREMSQGDTQNGWYHRWFLRGKVTSPIGARHPWDGYAVWSWNNSGEFFTWRSNDQPFQVDSVALGDRTVYQTLYAGGTLTPVVGSSVLLKVSPSLSYNGNQNYFHDNQDYHDAWRAGGTLQLTAQPTATHTVVAGLDGAYSTVRSNFLGTPGLTDVGVFLQDQWAITSRLEATAGARLDDHTTTESPEETSLNPKLALRYTLSPAVSLRASVGAGYRAPSAIEQFVSAIQEGYRVIPNPGLRGEHAVSGEVGLNARLWRGARLDAALFQNSYRDLIGPAAVPDSILVFQFQNVQRARIRGVDASLNTALIPHWLSADLTYMYLDAIDLDTQQWLPYRSRNNATVTVDALGGLAGVDVRYRSRIANVLVYPLDPRGDITTVDVRANYAVGDAVVQGKVSNVFNDVYPDVQERIPGQPRTVSLALVTRF